MTSAYWECLRQRHAMHLLTSNLVGRLPNGMGALAIALFLRAEGVSYLLVGVFTAAYGLTAAVGGPVLGRLVDRHGQPMVLLVSATGSAVGFLLLAVAGAGHIPTLVTAVVLAGLLTPPLEPCLRGLWPSVLSGERAVATAYALDASLQQVLYVAGPLLVVALVELFGAGSALWATGLLAIVGTLVFVAAPPVRRWRAEPRVPDWAGPLRAGALRTVLVSLLGVGAAVGVISILVIAYAESVRTPSLSGVLLGAHALGALVGGLAYGARAWPGDARGQVVWLVGALAVCYWPLATVAGPPVMIVLMLCSGLFLAPVLTSGFVVIGEVAPPGTVTEAFAWVTTVFLTGSSLGSALAGSVLEHVGFGPAFLLPGIAGSVAAAVLFASRRFRRPAVASRSP